MNIMRSASGPVGSMKRGPGASSPPARPDGDKFRPPHPSPCGQLAVGGRQMGRPDQMRLIIGAMWASLCKLAGLFALRSMGGLQLLQDAVLDAYSLQHTVCASPMD